MSVWAIVYFVLLAFVLGNEVGRYWELRKPKDPATPVLTIAVQSTGPVAVAKAVDEALRVGALALAVFAEHHAPCSDKPEIEVDWETGDLA